ncbi:DnaJ domain-containing protein [Selenomonas sp. GACV-9]|uniref:J domain-containing protein n=1 Tax=Selenomonas sp. GACV-9 TaxID=3158782 RepID=UPI0008EBF40D|nr:DnaJ domain-containing protein [Selenomonas ruminantium]
MKDYYQILGLSPTATKKEIKKAFRQLARKYHPDLHPGDKAAAEQFKLINEACQVLSDENKRARYDLDRKQQGQRQQTRQTASHTGNAQRQGAGPGKTDFSQAFSRSAFEEAFFAGIKKPQADGKAAGKKDPLDTSALFKGFFGFS